jgi:hypothetical protein
MQLPTKHHKKKTIRSIATSALSFQSVLACVMLSCVLFTRGIIQVDRAPQTRAAAAWTEGPRSAVSQAYRSRGMATLQE